MTGNEWHRAVNRRRPGGGIRAGPAISDEMLSRRRHDNHMNRQGATVKRLEVGVPIDIQLQLNLHLV